MKTKNLQTLAYAVDYLFNQEITEIEGASYEGEAKVLKFVEFE